MEQLSFQFKTKIKFSTPVADHSFRLHILPRISAVQNSELETVQLSPRAKYNCGSDGFGNRILTGSIAASHDEFSYECSGIICRDDSHLVESRLLPVYRYPSVLTVPSADIVAWATGFRHLGEAAVVVRAVQVAVYRHFTYSPGTTNVKTTAAEAFSAGVGVCQDYAHVFLAVVRELGLPARYVCGLTVGEGATHAWCEVYINGKWQGFDPTRNVAVDESYISLAVGRDYNDCAPERGVFRGVASQMQSTFMQVKRI